ncbi:MAG: hypothetical protein M1829_005910 [Trizodia sp. TS-e1964]|nr:MAG: hypothetical protein M1829_005910 [Trizodia sp. TS-e1964]
MLLALLVLLSSFGSIYSSVSACAPGQSVDAETEFVEWCFPTGNSPYGTTAACGSCLDVNAREHSRFDVLFCFQNCQALCGDCDKNDPNMITKTILCYKRGKGPSRGHTESGGPLLLPPKGRAWKHRKTPAIKSKIPKPAVEPTVTPSPTPKAKEDRNNGATATETPARITATNTPNSSTPRPPAAGQGREHEGASIEQQGPKISSEFQAPPGNNQFQQLPDLTGTS